MFNYISVSTGNCTIAVFKGSEDYPTIAELFEDIFQEISKVQKVAFVKTGENRILAELFLGGDYKVTKYVSLLDVLVSYYVINH